jgi:hypothetical protein
MLAELRPMRAYMDIQYRQNVGFDILGNDLQHYEGIQPAIPRAFGVWKGAPGFCQARAPFTLFQPPHPSTINPDRSSGLGFLIPDNKDQPDIFVIAHPWVRATFPTTFFTKIGPVHTFSV